MKSSRYTLTKILGSGSFGTVYKAVDDEGRKFAMKVVKYNKNDALKACIEREIQVMNYLKHENLVCIIDFYQENDSYYIVLEYLKGGDLQSYIDENQRIPEVLVRKWFRALVCALVYLEEQNVMHRDIKLSNIYLTDKKDLWSSQVKIGDFGFSRYLNNDIASSKIGTPLYMAPEIYEDNSYGFKADVWSLGCVLYEMLTSKPLFECFTIADLHIKHQMPLLLENIPDDAKVVINAAVHLDPHSRPSFYDLLSFEFMCGQQEPIEIQPIAQKKSLIRQSFHNPSGVFLNLEKEVNNVWRLIELSQEIECKSLQSTGNLIFSCCRQDINRLKSALSKLRGENQAENISRLQESLKKCESRLDEMNRGIKNRIPDYKIQPDIMEASVNRLIQSAFDLATDDACLLLSVCFKSDPDNSFIINNYENIINNSRRP